MKKKLFVLVLILGIISGAFCQNSGSSDLSGPMDLVVLLDTSASMSNSYRETSDYLIGPFLKEFLRIGDTFHLISFSDTPKLEISRRIAAAEDVDAVIGRLLLMYPLDPKTDVASVLSYGEKYASSLPGNRHRKIILITDGDEGNTQTLVDAASGRLKLAGEDLQYIKVPVSGNGPVSGRPAQVVQSPSQPKPAPAGQIASAGQPTKPAQTGQTSGSGQAAQTPASGQTTQTTGSGQTSQTPGSGQVAASTPKSSSTPQSPATSTTQSGAQSATSQTPSGSGNTQTAQSSTQPGSQTNNQGTSAAASSSSTTTVQGSAESSTTGTNQSAGNTVTSQSNGGQSSQNQSNQGQTNLSQTDQNQGQSNQNQQNQGSSQTGNQPGTGGTSQSTQSTTQGSSQSTTTQSSGQTQSTQTSSSTSKTTTGGETGYSLDIPLPLLIALILLALLLLGLIIFFATRRLHNTPNRAMAQAAAPMDTANRSRIEAERQERIRDAALMGTFAESQHNKPKPMPKDTVYTAPPVTEREGPLMLNLFVEDQNTAIGRRNIHVVKPGYTFTVGGGKSDFLIFLVPIPRHIADVQFDGSNCTFYPRKPQYFPDIGSQSVPNCIGKSIRVLSDKHYELHIRIDRYQDPLKALNKMLHSIAMPG
ncbi:MAG: VWA domain-containing protein [Treponema sp.]|nr:VWA domain-containing protein [Treponema sp.]